MLASPIRVQTPDAEIMTLKSHLKLKRDFLCCLETINFVPVLPNSISYS